MAFAIETSRYEECHRLLTHSKKKAPRDERDQWYLDRTIKYRGIPQIAVDDFLIDLWCIMLCYEISSAFLTVRCDWRWRFFFSRIRGSTNPSKIFFHQISQVNFDKIWIRESITELCNRKFIQSSRTDAENLPLESVGCRRRTVVNVISTRNEGYSRVVGIIYGCNM